jgi:hypothetical protein
MSSNGERARDRPDAIRMDLQMLILLGARERTEAEFRRLLGEHGSRADARPPGGLAGRAGSD